jgi:hypothetical protein
MNKGTNYELEKTDTTRQNTTKHGKYLVRRNFMIHPFISAKLNVNLSEQQVRSSLATPLAADQTVAFSYVKTIDNI